MGTPNPLRTEARNRGSARFFTGLPCKFGHVAERYTKRGDCVVCRAILVEHWRKKNRKRYLDGNRRWENENPERSRLNHMFAQASSRARKRNAIPPWVDMDEIKKIYEKCPIGMHVDHIWALNGKYWSGLHVPWNLQYLTRFENQSKGNRPPCI